ncbi:carbonic anhydrase/acetyltransferase-like protein (isoleucine patch superfamily) [Bartonella heixiaziensis]
MAVEKKYEFTRQGVTLYPDENNSHGIVMLRRIRALRDFGDVKKGDLGGLIEHEDNLSHEGDCWVDGSGFSFDDGYVFGNARVFGDARVGGMARVFGHAEVYGDADVFGDAYIYDHAKIYGNSKVYHSRVYGEAQIYENAFVRGQAEVYGNSRIFGNAEIYTKARVYGNAKVYEHAHVFDQSKVYDNALVHGHAKIRENAKIYGNADVCDYEDFRDNDEVYMRKHVSYSTNEAHKNDDGKPRIELIPPLALIEIGKVLEFGAKKYGANNWRNGMHWSRFHGAALRHLLAWFGGEHKDAESDLSHLAHAACCILFLMECEAQQIGHDDRPHKN